MRPAPAPSLFLLLTVATACSNAPSSPGGGTAQVRLFHAAAGIGTVTLESNGAAALAGVAYGSLTRPVEVAAGSQQFRVLAGAAAVAARSMVLEEGSRVTLVVSKQTGQVDLTATSDTGQAQPDRANLRLISAPEVPRAIGDSSGPNSVLDVYVTAPEASLTTATPRMAMDVLVPSYSSFLYYDPGQLQVRFTPQGTKTVVAQAGPIAFTAGEAKAVTIRRRADGSYTTSVEVVPETP